MLVVGESGYGKSIATAQALDKWLSSGSLGLWLPAHFLRDAACLESALDDWCRSLRPSLEPDAWRVVIDLAGKAGRLVVCVDDINRTPEAPRLLRLAVSLVTPPSGGPAPGNGSSGTPAPAHLLCQVVPIWPEQLSSLAPKVLEQPSVCSITVGNLHPDECSAIIRGKIPQISPVEARDFAALLNHDPFLVGLFTLMADQRMQFPELRSVADDVIGEFVDSQLRDTCSTGTADLLPTELLDVLVHVAHLMMLRRNLQPSWRELEGWLGDGSKSMRGMRLLVRQGKVCRLDADERLDFRHDRLRDRFLVQAMANLLVLPEPPEDVITDPFFSVIVGKALARTETPVERLARLRTRAPWVLFEAIRQVGEPNN